MDTSLKTAELKVIDARVRLLLPELLAIDLGFPYHM